MPKRSPKAQSENDINRQFGSRLRTCREFAGKSQTDVGNALGVSFQQIQKYENGTTSISLNRLYDVAAFLRISLSYLVTGAADRAGDHHASPGFAEDRQHAYAAEGDGLDVIGPITKQKLALLNAFDRINDIKVRRSVVAMVEALGGVPEKERSGAASG